MVTMRMCWCVRSGDDGGYLPNPQKGIFQPLAMVLSADILHATSVYHAGPRAQCLLHHALVLKAPLLGDGP